MLQGASTEERRYVLPLVGIFGLAARVLQGSRSNDLRIGQVPAEHRQADSHAGLRQWIVGWICAGGDEKVVDAA